MSTQEGQDRVNPYDPTKPIKYKIVGYWSGIVFENGHVYEDSEEAWREARKINTEISADVIVVIDDGRGTEKMDRFYPIPSRSNPTTIREVVGSKES